jgi:hypothetical protein
MKPENIKALTEALKPFAEMYIQYKQMEAVQDSKYLEVSSKHDRKIIYVLLSFLGVVILAMSTLTYLGKVSGDALLFAVGGTVGFIFGLVQRFIFGSHRSITTEN